MVFSSSIFLIYFLPVFLLVYFLADRAYRNYIALAGSIVFFAWGAPLLLFVVLGSVAMNYVAARWGHSLGEKGGKWLHVIVLIANIVILLFFQYFTFFSDTILSIAGRPLTPDLPWMQYLAPLGLSFITFHQISYLIDVRRGTDPPMKNFWEYALFIMYFPQLINGPINRVGEMAGQIRDRAAQYTLDNKLQGFIRFMIGLGKKVLIANVLAVEVNRIFLMGGEDLSTPLAWFAILAYAFQIYFDFAGYSDMAIGLGRMMGFILPENFNSPYTSGSVTDFWRRWHMSLSNWLRDYLFMPMSLSMRHAGKLGIVVSVMITFLICGMWHNPGWTFIVWGAWHGLWLALDQLFLLKVLKKTGRIIATLFTFFITTLGWVFFRSETFEQATLFFKRMFVYYNPGTAWGLKADFWTVMGIAILFSFITLFKFGKKWEKNVFEKNSGIGRIVIYGSLAIVIFILCLGSISTSGFIPFIYNRF